MPVDIQYLTSEGAASMRKELEEMKGPMRYKLSQRLRAAIQMGDLSENADYHAAKEEQGFPPG
jgi:transcription elongation factor GreA